MNKLLSFVLALSLFACSKEKDSKPSAPQQPVVADSSNTGPIVTGYSFKDINGSPTTEAGIPNIKTAVKIGQNNYYLAAYPNPTKDLLAIRWNSTSPTSKESIWIVAAHQAQNLNSFNFTQANTSLIGSQPLIKTEQSSQGGEFIANLETFPAGAYIVYVKIDSVLLWDNILKTN